MKYQLYRNLADVPDAGNWELLTSNVNSIHDAFEFAGRLDTTAIEYMAGLMWVDEELGIFAGYHEGMGFCVAPWFKIVEDVAE